METQLFDCGREGVLRQSGWHRRSLLKAFVPEQGTEAFLFKNIFEGRNKQW
ncbi:hypothetical protein [Christensenella massiliensis]|jgi:hypothetical protein|uniref:Uncharacterized protein n=1 Tax=Christensenella massiliensis TaxID=1805714 RepID=A0AAU8A8N0_9FIRM